MLDVWTPGVVSLLEAWITLLAMAVFVFHSYMQDRRWFMAPKEDLDGESGSLTRTTESEHLVRAELSFLA